MSTQQLPEATIARRTSRRAWWLLGLGLLVLLAGLAIYVATQRTPILTGANLPKTGQLNAATEPVADKIPTQAVSDAVMQPVANKTPTQAVPDAATQGIMGYLDAHKKITESTIRRILFKGHHGPD